MATSPTSGQPQLMFNLIPPPHSKDGNDSGDSNEKSKLPDFLISGSPLDYTASSLITTSSSKRYYEGCREIHESDIRKSLMVEAKRRKYWSRKVVEKMEFEEIEHICCYHYALESFTETRSTADATEPCAVGAMIEAQSSDSNKYFGASTQPGTSASIRNPWDYEVLPNAEFVGQTRVLELPSTSQYVPCSVCSSEGVSHCFHCRGFGTDKCGYCRGTGMKAGVAHPAVYTHPMVATFPHEESHHCHRRDSHGVRRMTESRGSYTGSGSGIVRPPAGSNNRPYAVGTPVHFMVKAGLPPPGIGQHDLCIFCQGRGIRDCHHCKGQGKKQCPTCGGHGSVRQFVKLKVFFAVERSDYFTPTDVPEVILRTASGEVSVCETQHYVLPLKKFPIKEINEMSKKLCSQHMQKSLGACRVIKQRQTVEAIPVAKVRYKIGPKKGGIFFVFGNERLCFIPKSPSKCSLM